MEHFDVAIIGLGPAGSALARKLAGKMQVIALDSTDILRSVLLKQPEKLNTAYWRATRKLRLKLFGKIVKSRCLTAPALRKWIMRSGVAHIPQLKD